MPITAPCQAASLCIPPSRRAVVCHVGAHQASHAPTLMVCAGPTHTDCLCPFSGRSLGSPSPVAPFAPLPCPTSDPTPPTPQGHVSPSMRHGVPAALPWWPPVRPYPAVRWARRASSAVRSPGATGAPQACCVPVCTSPTCRRECRAWGVFPDGASPSPGALRLSREQARAEWPVSRCVGLAWCLTRAPLPPTIAVGGWCRAGGVAGGLRAGDTSGGGRRRVQRRSLVPGPHLTRHWSGRPKRQRFGRRSPRALCLQGVPSDLSPL
jgi:hypothetical protein